MTPVAVRYGYADNPPVNLFAKGENGLPAVPFKSDEW
jgi:sialate O-acetylesterase